MNAASIDIQDIIETESSSSEITAYPISIGGLVEDRSNCTSIIDTPGGPPQLTLDNAAYEFSSIQIKVRASNYEEGLTHLRSIKELLHGRANEVWNSTLYTLIKCLNEPGFLMRENQRFIFVSNFSIQRRAE